jgi:hypothetical protein
MYLPLLLQRAGVTALRVDHVDPYTGRSSISALVPMQDRDPLQTCIFQNVLTMETSATLRPVPPSFPSARSPMMLKGATRFAMIADGRSLCEFGVSYLDGYRRAIAVSGVVISDECDLSQFMMILKRTFLGKSYENIEIVEEFHLYAYEREVRSAAYDAGGIQYYDEPWQLGGAPCPCG